MKRRLGIAAVLLAMATSTAACGSDNSTGNDTGTTLTVYAASSLKNVFSALGQEFEASHPGVHVEFDFAGSSDLVAQIQQGAPADVIATADTANMDKLATSGDLAGKATDFASNTLEIAVHPGNPLHIDSLTDLAGKGVNLVVCAPEVPCGAAAQKVADAAQLTLHPVSEEQSVTDVLGKVIAGEGDAGLVYVTDIKAAGGKVDGVTFPEAADAVNTYPITTVAGNDHADLAQAFVALVLGADGQKALKDADFAKP
jgi:molybdate transport system substrate-binding protein